MLLDQQFNIVSEKLQQLLKQYHKLQKENEKLNETLREYQQREKAMEQKVQELEQRISVLKLAAGEMDDADKKEFEKKLNQYIKEVDRCISFLSE